VTTKLAESNVRQGLGVFAGIETDLGDRLLLS
jgi:hypothetical protein